MLRALLVIGVLAIPGCGEESEENCSQIKGVDACFEQIPQKHSRVRVRGVLTYSKKEGWIQLMVKEKARADIPRMEESKHTSLSYLPERMGDQGFSFDISAYLAADAAFDTAILKVNPDSGNCRLQTLHFSQFSRDFRANGTPDDPLPLVGGCAETIPGHEEF